MIHLRRLYEDPSFIENTSHISSTITFFEQTSISRNIISSDQTSIETDFTIRIIFEKETKTFEARKKDSFVITFFIMIVNFSEVQRNEMIVIIT